MAYKEKLLDSIFDCFANFDYIKTGDIPNIDLYMDQVTTFMDEHLKASKRREEDKVLTKTMINNYAKNHLLPPPVKKKYSREHLLVLIFIYYFKGFLSFQDIQSILNPLTERFFQSDSDISLEQIYQEVFQMGHDELQLIEEDIKRLYQRSSEAFADAPKEEGEFLRAFSIICLLSFDVYVKKQLIEKIIDDYNAERFCDVPKTEEKNKQE